jgi:hypothetical protein
MQCIISVKRSFNTLLNSTLSLFSSLNVRDQVPHPRSIQSISGQSAANVFVIVLTTRKCGTSTVRISREIPCGMAADVVRFGGKVFYQFD